MRKVLSFEVCPVGEVLQVRVHIPTRTHVIVIIIIIIILIIIIIIITIVIIIIITWEWEYMPTLPPIRPPLSVVNQSTISLGPSQIFTDNRCRSGRTSISKKWATLVLRGEIISHQ